MPPTSLELPAPPLPCMPPAWARGGHLQTLLGHLLPSAAPSLIEGHDGVRRVEVPLADGDTLVALEAPGESSLVVSLFHGLSGDANADYVRRAAHLLRRRGHTVVAVNHRGCGAGAGRAVGTYHSGCKDDLAAVLALLRRRHPGRRQLCVGFSLSGNALLRLLVEGGEALPDAGLAIHPPIDLAACSRRVSQGLSRLYERRFVLRLRRAILERARDGLVRPDVSLSPLASLRELDELWTAPRAGFRDADDYYARCSTHTGLGRVRTPCVVLAAEDDPIVPVAAFRAARPSPWVHLHVERHGGHMGYLQGAPTPLGDRRWLDLALVHYVGLLGSL